MSLPKYSHPGDGYMYVICDVCGKKVRQKDTVYIQDRFNTLNNRVVCKEDYEKTNPQNTPIKIRETYRPDPVRVRSEPADRYVTYPNSSIVPGAPRLLTATPSTLGTTIDLFWQAPDNSGDSPIIGYRVKRGFPQAAPLEVLESNTLSPNTYYMDDTGDINFFYTYQVAAINSAGVGPYSDIAYYPYEENTTGVDYLLASDTGYFLLTSDTGTLIELSQ